MSRISIYSNKRASNSHDSFIRELKNHLFRHETKINQPKSVDELRALLEKDLEEKVEYIFAIGGDGTVNTILQKIANTSINLLIIPAGTANDLAKEVGMDRTIKKIMKVFQHRTSSEIDLIKVNDRFMATNGGIGCAADVALKINLYRENYIGFLNIMKNVGANIYPLVFTKEMAFAKMKRYHLKLESPDLPLPNPIIKAPIVLVNNQSVLGGKFKIAPETKNNDGKFNVTILKHKTKAALLNCSFNLLTGRYPHKDKDLVSFETNKIKISNMDNDPLSFLGDGEILCEERVFEIQACPQALKVFIYTGELDYHSSHDLEEISLL